MASVLLAGETWVTHSIHQKGFDTFTTSEFVSAGDEFCAALEAGDHRVERIAAHRIGDQFPETAAELGRFEVVVLSDIGANSFLLAPRTFQESQIVPNKLEALRAYVEAGGGLLMVGGYMSFSGIDGKARYADSPLAAVLPVEMETVDDRVEKPEGSAPACDSDHPAVAGLAGQWPPLLGWNRVRAKASAQLLARCGSDPLLVVDSFGKGRCAAFASDLAPHWAPPEFLAWKGYPRLWNQLIQWLAAAPS